MVILLFSCDNLDENTPKGRGGHPFSPTLKQPKSTITPNSQKDPNAPFFSNGGIMLTPSLKEDPNEDHHEKKSIQFDKTEIKNFVGDRVIVHFSITNGDFGDELRCLTPSIDVEINVWNGLITFEASSEVLNQKFIFCLEDDESVRSEIEVTFEREDLKDFSLGYSRDVITDSSTLSGYFGIPAYYEKIYLGISSCNEGKRKVKNLENFSVEYFIDENPENKFKLANNVLSWKVGEVNDGDEIKIKAKATVSTGKSVESEIIFTINKKIGKVSIQFKQGKRSLKSVSIKNNETETITCINPKSINEVQISTSEVPIYLNGQLRCTGENLTFEEFEKLRKGDVYEIITLYGGVYKLQLSFDKEKTKKELSEIFKTLDNNIKELMNEEVKKIFLDLNDEDKNFDKCLIDFRSLVLNSNEESGSIFKDEYDTLFKKLFESNKKMYRTLVLNNKKLGKYHINSFPGNSLENCFVKNNSFYIRDKEIDDNDKGVFCKWIFDFYDSLYHNRLLLEQVLQDLEK